MGTTFVNPTLNPEIDLGVNRFEETDPIRLGARPSGAELEIAIAAIYRQVLGNAYVMESERPMVLESQLRNGEISVRQFVRLLAKSDLYRNRFMDNCPRYRSIELNFKHLLGRAPEHYTEMSHHSHLLDLGGWDLEIDAYIDSDEYQHAFGEHTVPYYRGYKTQVGKNITGFTHMFSLLRGASSSDKDLAQQNRSRLNSKIITNAASQINPLEGVGSISELFYAPEPETPEYYHHNIPAPAYTSGSKDMAQDRKIAALRKQLSELTPFASIGVAQLSGDWQSTPATRPQSGGTSKTAQIASLEAQIAEARRYATIGEARLNKWRGKVFNS
jgi:phycoerythrin-associated linker protein